MNERWKAEDRGYETPCWIWQGPINVHGYGRVTLGERRLMAHRCMYEMAKGPIPKGLDIDHLCRVRACVNPDHMEPVTRAENVRRGQSPAMLTVKTNHCQRGHEMTPENTIIVKSTGARKCRTCVNQRKVADYHRKKQEIGAHHG